MTPCKQLAVIVPAYGLRELTASVVSNALTESPLLDVVVVDNAGDYRTVASERVERPGSNLGWLGGCNHGLRSVMAQAYRGFVLLNNDTTLSPSFFAGMLAAAETGIGVVGPCYDDFWPWQHCGYSGPAGSFEGRSRVRRVPFVDGTCMLITRAAIDAIGILDDEHFGSTGWGADIDYALRARIAGLHVRVTEAAYLNHHPGSTARLRQSPQEYWEAGQADMRAGLELKWGQNWARLSGVDGSWAPSAPGRVVRRVRARAGRTRASLRGDVGGVT